MILFSHAIVGGALGRFFPQNPIAAFVIGFASHFVLDAIPHWQYSLGSMVNQEDPFSLDQDMTLGKTFVRDLVKIVIDCFAGFVALLFLFYFHRPFMFTLDASWISVFAGAVGGVLPDALQFVYYKTKSPILLPLQKFHMWVHTKKVLDDQPWIGIPFQTAIVLFAVLLPFVTSVAKLQ